MRRDVMVWAVATFIIVLMALGLNSCKKAAVERVVGHRITWWDYFLVTP